ncbi:Ger(x)C family spore germination protein [Paenibacillus sp. SZ31]|uniref:Ger(x)C family spore germination protein n=1 Tax=Paenibacillus sp. SZ31 TaxID=2725555 RepID=UPI00146D084D|nr:Ger(x)C family spore germination protein [Paenibacillus sp. SZ31]NMI03704.1 Ger(x)C family spore germination protein [Paenibacillus sp. SZ31]
MRISRVLLLPILSCVLLSGCWDRIEINDLAIVLATGIDYEEGKVQLTSQIFVPRKAGGGDSSGSGGSPSGVTMIRTAEGRTIAEALNRLQRKVPRNMFWGHCEVIIISEQAGKRGIREYIDFFLRYPQFREHAYVFSSEKAAKDILALLDPLERSSAESLREMANLKLGTRITALELAKSIEGPSSSVILSRMLILPPEPDQDKLTTTPYVKGLSLYNKDRYVKTVKEPLSVGVLLLAKELNNIIMPVEFEPLEGTFSIRLIDIKTTLKPRIVNQHWSMKVDIQTSGEVVLNTTDANLTDPAVLTKLEKEWSAKLTSLAYDALDLSQKELRSDFFKFAVEFRRYYPKQWKKQEKNWETLYPELDVEVKVDAHVVRTGKSTGPQGIPNEDET